MSAHHYYTSTPPMPMAAGKVPQYMPPYQHAGYRTGSISPPERPQSSTTSGHYSSVPSYSNSATPSTYAGSNSGDYDVPASSIDLMDLLNDRMETVYDPLPMDRSLAKQAQTSGSLNAKQRELLELQALAQRRLAGARANFADGIQAAKDVKRDLDWTQKRVTALNRKAERKYPDQYRAAQSQIPPLADY